MDSRGRDRDFRGRGRGGGTWREENPTSSLETPDPGRGQLVIRRPGRARVFLHPRFRAFAPQPRAQIRPDVPAGAAGPNHPPVLAEGPEIVEAPEIPEEPPGDVNQGGTGDAPNPPAENNEGAEQPGAEPGAEPGVEPGAEPGAEPEPEPQ